MSPILLLNRETSQSFDDAGVAVTKSIVGRSRSPKPYEHVDKLSEATIPKEVHSLVYYCIKALVEFPDELHVLGSSRLPYRDEPRGELMKLLVPSWETPHFTLRQIDPRLWAVLVQVYKDLPNVLFVYPIALSDPHLPLLQRIRSTPDFALITVLDLNHCMQLNDDTIIDLKTLYNLSCFDCGSTQISKHGLSSFSRTQGSNEVGGSALRILRLRDCNKIDDDVYKIFETFSLLSVIDLSGTRCTSAKIPPNYRYRLKGFEKLFEPYPMIDAMKYLQTLERDILPNTEPLVLFVTPEYKLPQRQRSSGNAKWTGEKIFSISPNVRRSDHDSEVAGKTGFAKSEAFYRSIPSPTLTDGLVSILYPKITIQTDLMLLRRPLAWSAKQTIKGKARDSGNPRDSSKLEIRKEDRSAVQKWTAALLVKQLQPRTAPQDLTVSSKKDAQTLGRILSANKTFTKDLADVTHSDIMKSYRKRPRLRLELKE